MDGAAIEGARRRRWLRRAGYGALAGLLLAMAGLAVLWSIRFDLAQRYLDDEFARHGVQASYRLTRIGFGAQILEGLVIGDPRRPDLTADHVAVEVAFGLGGPRIGLITARGVRLHGRIEGGRLRLGEVDKLLGPPSNAPFRLPDQRLDLRDAALGLETPLGRVDLGFAGSGNLARDFRGGVALVSPQLRWSDCVLSRPIARLNLEVAGGRPRLQGPAAMARAACNGVVAKRPLFALNALLAPGLDHWRGTTAIRVASLRSGAQNLAAVEGRIGFDGDARETGGEVALSTGAATSATARAAGLRLAGRYSAAPAGNAYALDGRAELLGLTSDQADGIARALRGARGSPAGPVAEALARAVLAAGREGANAAASVAATADRGGGQARIGDIQLVARSGLHISQIHGDGLAYAWPAGRIAVAGDFAIGGGGFPDTRLSLARTATGAIQGEARIAPMVVGGARLALGPVAFDADPAGRTRFRTLARMDGPLGSGRVTGLVLPLSGEIGDGRFVLGATCIAASFEALRYQSLSLGPTRLPLCPLGRAIVASGPRGVEVGAEVRAPRLRGRLGQTPIGLAAERFRFAGSGFTTSRLVVVAGPADRLSRAQAASLAGRFVDGGMAGRFEGLAGSLGGVPLRIGDGSGAWRLRGAALAVQGRAGIADAQTPARFTPLVSEDIRLTLVDNRIRATGTLLHPASRTRVAVATIDHDLASGFGHALLDVAGLRFSPAFQPEALTPLTVGVVALVDGSVSGQGRIAWDGRGVRSTGTFSTENMNLAAPFGPVEGLTTRIAFTDLLGLTSAPGQEARIRLIQTGIDVYDGIVRYQLRPDYHVAVESARWPLAGGTLALEPTILDFSRESVKSLTFRVDALDAARFIQQLQFSNIAATGTFDGVIPMRFDQSGGRVVGGRLVARPAGGTLSYVGELSDRDLGAYGVLAFDALKSLRYSRLDIDLDGALAGEFLTRINLDGIARNPQGTREPGGGISGMIVGRVLHQLARIPFHFNIRVQGPFRALIATARSFQDPRDLIRASLPQLLEQQTPPEPPIQPHESEPVP